jgi:hypothetical protein
MTTTIAALSGPQIRYAEFVQLVNPSFTDYFTAGFEINQR